MTATTDPDTTTSDVLTGTLRMVAATTSLRGGAEALASDGIGLLVVVNAAGDLAGVVSERDLVAAVADGVDLDAERLADVMADEVVTIASDDSLDDAAERMVTADVRHVVVVDAEGQPVGVVSARDVMRRAVAATAGS